MGETRNRVLTDHKKIGKRFVPPLLASTTFVPTSWSRLSAPELLWITMLEGEDFFSGYELALALVATTSGIAGGEKWYYTVSAFSSLTPDQASSIRSRLGDLGALGDIQKALAPLVRLYPVCPLAFLWKDGPSPAEPAEDLMIIKSALGTILDKYRKETLLAQVTVIRSAFALDKIGVGPEVLLLPRLAESGGMEELLRFPETEESKQLASVVFSWIPIIFAEPIYDRSAPWPAYFWNRGLELESCRLMESGSRE